MTVAWERLGTQRLACLAIIAGWGIRTWQPRGSHARCLNLAAGRRQTACRRLRHPAGRLESFVFQGFEEFFFSSSFFLTECSVLLRSARSSPQPVRGAAPSRSDTRDRSRCFCRVEGRVKTTHCSRSSGVERILGKDEVEGSIPPASSRAITINLNRLQQNNNHHGKRSIQAQQAAR